MRRLYVLGNHARKIMSDIAPDRFSQHNYGLVGLLDSSDHELEILNLTPGIVVICARIDKEDREDLEVLIKKLFKNHGRSRIIVLDGDWRCSTASEWLWAGADAVLPMPFTTGHFFAQLEALDRRMEKERKSEEEKE